MATRQKRLIGRGSSLNTPRPRLPMQIEGKRLGHLLAAGQSVTVQRIRMTLPLVVDSASVAAGAVAKVYTVSTSTIQKWSAWQSIFQEYAIVGARFRVTVTNATTPSGFYAAFLDELSVSAPVAADLSKPRLNLSSDPTESPSDYVLEWKADDYNDLKWTGTSAAAFAVVYLKIFATNAATLTAAGTAGQVLINGEVAVDFRGLI